MCYGTSDKDSWGVRSGDFVGANVNRKVVVRALALAMRDHAVCSSELSWLSGI